MQPTTCLQKSKKNNVELARTPMLNDPYKKHKAKKA